MKKDRYEDDIDFQWGETKYDCSFLDEKGGKYHRNNPDGSITEFNPPALRMKTAVSVLNDKFLFKVLKKWDLLKMKSPIEATKAVYIINNNYFLLSRGISAKAEKNRVCIFATNVVLEDTYFPAKGPSS